MTRNDGGPAYPNIETGDGCAALRFEHHGMSLRDYFAGQAIIGLLATPANIAAVAREEGISSTKVIASAAYEMADAMLVERAKGK